MPRGWRGESHRPDTADSQRGRSKLPHLWRRTSCDRESNSPSVSSPDNYLEPKRINETTESVDLTNIPTLFNEKLDVPSNTTITLDSSSSNTATTSSPVNLQPEAKPTLHSLDGVLNHSLLVSDGSSNISSKAASNSSAAKPLSLLPFLAGMPSNTGMVGSTVALTSTPQWMQFLSKQDAGGKYQDMSSGL